MSFVPFEELRVFQMAERLADDIWNRVLNWNIFAKDTVGKQIVRAADSVGANIAEGSGRLSKKDNRRFVKMSRGSLNETIYWLRRAEARNLLQKSEVEQLKQGANALARSLNAYLSSINPTTEH